MLNDNALMWAISFLLVYALAQLVVSKHPRFASFSPMQKSISVKILAIAGFCLAYGLFSVLQA